MIASIHKVMFHHHDILVNLASCQVSSRVYTLPNLSCSHRDPNTSPTVQNVLRFVSTHTLCLYVCVCVYLQLSTLGCSVGTLQRSVSLLQCVFHSISSLSVFSLYFILSVQYGFAMICTLLMVQKSSCHASWLYNYYILYIYIIANEIANNSQFSSPVSSLHAYIGLEQQPGSRNVWEKICSWGSLQST